MSTDEYGLSPKKIADLTRSQWDQLERYIERLKLSQFHIKKIPDFNKEGLNHSKVKLLIEQGWVVLKHSKDYRVWHGSAGYVPTFKLIRIRLSRQRREHLSNTLRIDSLGLGEKHARIKLKLKQGWKISSINGSIYTLKR